MRISFKIFIAIFGAFALLLSSGAFADSGLIKTKNRLGQTIYVMPPAGMSVAKGEPKHKLQVKNPYGQHPEFLRQVVAYNSDYAPGTVVVDTNARFLYLVLSGNRAMRWFVD